MCRPSRVRPSRVDGTHDGFDKRKQSVKMADIFGIEKVWRGIQGSCCEHGDSLSLRSNHDFKFLYKILRIKESHPAVVERSYSAEYGRRNIIGTMQRMHTLARVKGLSVCDYYTVPQSVEISE